MNEEVSTKFMFIVLGIIMIFLLISLIIDYNYYKLNPNRTCIKNGFIGGYFWHSMFFCNDLDNKAYHVRFVNCKPFGNLIEINCEIEYVTPQISSPNLRK